MDNTTESEFPGFVIFVPGSNNAIDRIIGGIVVLCMILGITGNISSGIYFWRRRVSSFPMRLYVIVCGVDTCTSIFAFPVVAVLFNDRLPVLFSNYVICGAWAVIFNFLQRFSMFMVLIVSSTRAMAIFLPFNRVNRKAALAACGCFGMYLLTMDSVYLGLGYVSFVFWSPAGCCGVGPTTDPAGYIWLIYILQLLAIVFIISIAVFISFFLSSAVLLRRKNFGCEGDRKSRDVSVTIALFTVVFLFCNLPLFSIQLTDSCLNWFKLDRSFFDRSPFVMWYGWLLSHHFFTTLNAALNPCLYFLRMRKLRIWMFVKMGESKSGLERGFSTMMSTTRRHTRNWGEVEGSGLVWEKESTNRIILHTNLQAVQGQQLDTATWNWALNIDKLFSNRWTWRMITTHESNPNFSKTLI